MTTMSISAERIEVDDDLWSVQSMLEEKGWGDGLPVIPPTEDRVERMLGALKRKPDDVIGVVPPRWAQATAATAAHRAD